MIWILKYFVDIQSKDAVAYWHPLNAPLYRRAAAVAVDYLRDYFGPIDRAPMIRFDTRLRVFSSTPQFIDDQIRPTAQI